MQYKQYRTSVFLALLLSLTLLVSSPARAQRGGGRFIAPSSGAMRRAPVGVGSAASAATSHRTRNFQSFSGFSSVGNNFGFLGTGGSGQDLGIQAAINPATQLRLAFAQRFLRNNQLFGGGYYLLDGGEAYVIPTEPAAESDAPPQEQQPPVVLVQQAPPQQAAAAEAQPSLPDEGEFTLVLQGGKEIQASAFSQMNGNIVYISPDGTRHTLSVSDLDASATEHVNEEHGTPVQLHL